MTTTHILIPSTLFAGDADIDGDPQKAAAYYSKNKSLQTISWTTFTGTLTIEATLDALSGTDNYFPISTDTIIAAGTVTLEGNYTWIRATITDFTAGTVEVTVAY